jgi:hypothetical protein
MSRVNPEEQLMSRYEDSAARATEVAVDSEAFGALLARTAENAAAVMGLWAGACDLVLRNLRLAGQADVARLGTRLGRTEDKLERVLQELYAVQDTVASRERP